VVVLVESAEIVVSTGGISGVVAKNIE
jgi:hypothetical protein